HHYTLNQQVGSITPPLYRELHIWLSFSHPQCKKTLTGLSFPPQTLALRLILPVNIRYQELSYHSISHSQK
ncbi:hypothetical protein ACNHRE_005586, partial [Klebsiella pneumoniae]